MHAKNQGFGSCGSRIRTCSHLGSIFTKKRKTSKTIKNNLSVAESWFKSGDFATRAVKRRAQACFEAEGGHFEYLL